MDSASYSGFSRVAETTEVATKMVVVGGFGVGKTTMIGSVSEIVPLRTEEVMTHASVGVDSLRGIEGKNETTVAFDFGRVTINAREVLYLFGAPGQKRFWFLWDQLFLGALGAVVLVDSRRIQDAWYSIDRLEKHQVPFVVARNRFEEPAHPLDQVREALSLDSDVPLLDCDARDRESCKHVFISLVRTVKARALARATAQVAQR